MAELLENAFAKLPRTPSPISAAPERSVTTRPAPTEAAPAETPTLTIIKIDPEAADDNPETANDEEPPTVVFELPY